MREAEAKSRFPELLRLRVPAGASDALDELARRQHRTRSEVVRTAVFGELAANGLTLDPEFRAELRDDPVVASALALVAKVRGEQGA